jgi:hypothetical protein
MFVIRAWALVALVVIGTALPAFAGERKVKESDVPKAALDAVKKKYPTAKLTGFSKEEDDGKTHYEVTLEEGARRLDVDLSPEGKILVEEETIAQDALPAEVRKALAASRYAKWTVKRVERIVKEENAADPSYELLLTDADQGAEVVFDKAGKIVEEEIRTHKKEGKEKGAEGEDDEDD